MASKKKAIKPIKLLSLPQQPDGMPQGKHLTGFKGTKVEGICLCAGCHPNAQGKRGKPLVLNYGRKNG